MSIALPLWSLSPDDVRETQVQLRRLAVDPRAKRRVLADPFLYGILLNGAADFIAGETTRDAVVAVERANATGHTASVDFMGENIDSVDAAIDIAGELIYLIDELDAVGLNSSLSFDLTHIGLGIDRELALENLCRVATRARASGREVMISAETADRTDAILEVYERANSSQANIGITLQAYLDRTASDLARILPSAKKVRIVKGAFEALPGQAVNRGAELNARFARLVEMTSRARVPVSIATHDIGLQEQCLARTDDSTRAEVEHLKHIAEDRLADLHRRGVETRLYVTYGREWFLYACNRLAEHPPNIIRAVGRCIEAYFARQYVACNVTPLLPALLNPQEQ